MLRPALVLLALAYCDGGTLLNSYSYVGTNLTVPGERHSVRARRHSVRAPRLATALQLGARLLLPLTSAARTVENMR